MSVRSASRGSPAARSIRLALRTSSIVATSSASFVRWVLRWFGRRRLSSELMLSAISVMPFMRRFQSPPRAKALNHKPTPHVNSLPAELIDGKLVQRQSAIHPMVEQRSVGKLASSPQPPEAGACRARLCAGHAQQLGGESPPYN